jgi:hypothetical protein
MKKWRYSKDRMSMILRAAVLIYTGQRSAQAENQQRTTNRCAAKSPKEPCIRKGIWLKLSRTSPDANLESDAGATQQRSSSPSSSRATLVSCCMFKQKNWN